MKRKARPQSAQLDLRPAVCGYVRVEHPDETAVAEWKDTEVLCVEAGTA